MVRSSKDSCRMFNRTSAAEAGMRCCGGLQNHHRLTERNCRFRSSCAIALIRIKEIQALEHRVGGGQHDGELRTHLIGRQTLCQTKFGSVAPLVLARQPIFLILSDAIRSVSLSAMLICVDPLTIGWRMKQRRPNVVTASEKLASKKSGLVPKRRVAKESTGSSTAANALTVADTISTSRATEEASALQMVCTT
jgi:hypothetical protein